MVENYLKNLVEQHQPETTLENKIARISGKIQLPVDFDEEKNLREHYQEKHLR